MRSIEGIIEPDGSVRLLEDIHVGSARRVVVTILDEPSDGSGSVAALLSEDSLAEDWSRPEEEEAWAHLRRET